MSELKIDSVTVQKGAFPINLKALYRAQASWESGRKLREQRLRCLKFTYGDQYADLVTYDGKTTREDEYIYDQGGVPLQTNLIRRLVRSVLGEYKKSAGDMICIARDRDEQSLGEMMTITMQANRKVNKMELVELRAMEELLVSGMVFFKEEWGWQNNQMDTWTSMINPNNIFFDGVMQDPRHWDLSIIGQIHDMEFGVLASTFCKKRKDYDEIAKIYRLARDKENIFDYHQKNSRYTQEVLDFLTPSTTGLCRVVELWTMEQKQRFRCHDRAIGDFYIDEINNEAEIIKENNRRKKQARIAGGEVKLIEYEWFIDNYWYYRFMTPFGQVLMEGESPYNHKSHPYSLRLHPFTDGKVQSFVADIIDQQKYINRGIVLNDMAIRASIKGLMMFPEQLLSDDMPVETLTKNFARMNGMIIYKHNANIPLPTQIKANSVPVGMNELVMMQMQAMENISGVHGATQGRQANAGVSGVLYAQQAQNSATTLIDLIESFQSVVEDSTVKKVKNIQQFYTDERNIIIAGKKSGLRKYMPDMARDVQYDLSITESTSNPAYRLVANEYLLKFWEAGQISLQQLLEIGQFPFGDELLQLISADDEQNQQAMAHGGEMTGGMIPQQMPQQPAPIQ